MPANLTIIDAPIRANGKSLIRSGEIFFLKGVRLDGVGGTLDLNAKVRLRRRLEELKAANTTGVVLTEAQMHPALDIVTAAGMTAVVELAVAIEDLADAGTTASIISSFAHIANIHRGSRGLLAYVIDLRGMGELPGTGSPAQLSTRAIGRRLKGLLHTLKRHDPRVLAAIARREGCPVAPFIEEDFLYNLLPTDEAAQTRERVAGLLETAGPRPLIVEFADAREGQDESIDAAFATGAAGVVARPLTVQAGREWFPLRMIRQTELLPFASVEIEQSDPRRIPTVSVAVCAGDRAFRLRECLESLNAQAYPNYEIVVVDCGNNPRIAQDAAAFPRVRLISAPREGTAARNAAIEAACGEIVALTDADCVPGPDWIRMLVRAMLDRRLDGCFGPVYPRDGAMAYLGAASDLDSAQDYGGASGISSSNMAFSRAALIRMGGFDSRLGPIAAAIDLRMRMEAAGCRIAKSEGAFVWRLPARRLRCWFAEQARHGRDEVALRMRYGAPIKREGSCSRAQRAKRLMSRVWSAASHSPIWILFWVAMALRMSHSAVVCGIAAAMLAAGPVSMILKSAEAFPYRRFGVRLMVGIVAYFGALWRESGRELALARAVIASLSRMRPGWERIRWPRRAARGA
jgi:glycosyltransferase involved in cell wall biosynthesis